MFISNKFPHRRFNSIEELRSIEEGKEKALWRLKILSRLLAKSYIVDIEPVKRNQEDGKASKKE